MTISKVLNQIDNDLPDSLERLFELLRIQSISTDPAYKDECQKAADWLVSDLNSIGFNASKRETPGHPMVIGHSEGAGPHIMFYGHYDVQPADPLELWSNPPFEPIIEDTKKGKVIRARGASDDKGQLMTFVEACRAWQKVNGQLPVKVSILFEGEEESGSPSLVPFMKTNASELTADIALICDTGLYGEETPAIITMLRGIVKIELQITGPSRDLHSGMYGGISINPIRVLNKILAGLHDDKGKITLPKFYEGVSELPEEIATQWENLSFDHSHFLKEVGLSEPAGELDRSPLEMIWSRPTCDVNGISGGYEGDGFKTVLPSKASAKISFRLVGDQNPIKIIESLKAYVQENLPQDCSVHYIEETPSKATHMSTDNPAFEKARQALSLEWPKDATFVGCGGSIPIAGHFKDILDTDAMLIGFGKDDDQIHSPNEKYDLSSFHRGIRSWARILDKLSEE
ncbi:MAG: M20/M25/M40 family metallo-hydrolase [Paracoccaceae bacterium]|jgi:acetylornithine deacetylase/succinyl-diaminopimelate desuccinylase-like protein|nr:M20/M25/M40 family metallo-hydrolase [Paracoccaceae bacterium]